MPKPARVVLLGPGDDLSGRLRGVLQNVDLEQLPAEPGMGSIREVGARRPTIVITDLYASEPRMDALRAVAPQAWILDTAGIVRRRPERGMGPWPTTKPFRLKPL